MDQSKVVRILPSAQPKQIEEQIINKYSESWFYEFVFSDGMMTTPTDQIAKLIHHTRAELIFPFLDELFGDKWNEIRCLDTACNQGWFTMQVSSRGAKEVLGIDVRADHIEMASAIKYLTNMGNVNFEKRDLFSINPKKDGKYELTLFLGILYHLDNPLEALRIIHSVTKRICVIESQVARPGLELDCLWGSGAPKHGPGIAIVHSDEHHVEGKRPVVLVPTLSALYRMLYAVGFTRLYLSIPQDSMYSQYADFDRVVVFANVS
jgi:2-polyprenyl-3-methyl-5-hydroxy-6-metoxy-1,4-benzoquinol methylase